MKAYLIPGGAVYKCVHTYIYIHRSLGSSKSGGCSSARVDRAIVGVPQALGSHGHLESRYALVFVVRHGGAAKVWCGSAGALMILDLDPNGSGLGEPLSQPGVVNLPSPH